MTDRSQAYLEILQFGLMTIREVAHDGDCALAEIEAEHLHNIPSLIDEPNEHRHRYYFEKERPRYLESLSNLKIDEGSHLYFALQRYKECWEILKACLPDG